LGFLTETTLTGYRELTGLVTHEKVMLAIQTHSTTVINEKTELINEEMFATIGKVTVEMETIEVLAIKTSLTEDSKTTMIEEIVVLMIIEEKIETTEQEMIEMKTMIGTTKMHASRIVMIIFDVTTTMVSKIAMTRTMPGISEAETTEMICKEIIETRKQTGTETSKGIKILIGEEKIEETKMTKKMKGIGKTEAKIRTLIIETGTKKIDGNITSIETEDKGMIVRRGKTEIEMMIEEKIVMMKIGEESIEKAVGLTKTHIEDRNVMKIFNDSSETTEIGMTTLGEFIVEEEMLIELIKGIIEMRISEKK